jgi:hypothetical protein
MNSNDAFQEIEYEGKKYLLFNDFQDFTKEIQKTKNAVLRTNFSSIKNQFSVLFKLFTDSYGANSNELRAIMNSLLFCGSCGVTYNSSVLVSLITSYKNVSPLEKCPKCGSDQILFLYHCESLITDVTETDIKNIRQYYKYLATLWWNTKTESKKCDSCMKSLKNGEGYVFGIIEGKNLRSDRLLCEECTSKELNDPDLLRKLKDYPDYMGKGLIQKAREYAEFKK